MGKRVPPAPFPVYANATTVGPQVTRAFTSSSALQAKTVAGVLDHDGARLRIFRQSSTDHDNLSCEIYKRDAGRWVRWKEEPVKHVPPSEFQGRETSVEGVPVWSFEELSPQELDQLRALLRHPRPD